MSETPTHHNNHPDDGNNNAAEHGKSLNFLEQIIEADLASGKYGNRVHTRFPPEPNGYLHIGHAKSICLNFGLAQKYGGKTNLRFDDTNPAAEEQEFVDSIMADIRWLGFEWDALFFASDYFDQLYQWAVQLISEGKAYVDDSSPEAINQMRGNLNTPGTESPYRNRTIAENLALFERMKNGEFAEGSCVLRAKIDMTSPNVHFRDPVLYRIKFAHHHRTGNKWCIYPMYDWAHGQSDSIERITHSICTLEFEVHRPLYDWFVAQLNIYKPQQYEFARLNLNYTVMSKRKLKQLVEEQYVNGWDDPRMPTISGMRRRGYTPAGIRLFADKVGIARRENIIDMGLLEFCVRENLNKIAKRVMVVLDPLKLVITNYPEDKVEQLKTENNPEDPQADTREIPFSKVLYVEREDFMENPTKKFFRLGVGNMVRLKSAYIIRCDEAIKNEAGEVTELRCTYLPESRSGNDTSGLKVQGTLHWVSAQHALPIEVRQYDRLFMHENPAATDNYLELLPQALAEPSLAAAKVGEHFQFIRKGYFCTDPDSSLQSNENSGTKVFNRTVTLKDGWPKKG